MWVLKHFEKQNSWDTVCIPHLLIVALNLQRTKALILLITLGWWLCGWGVLHACSPSRSFRAAGHPHRGELWSKDAQATRGWGALTGEGAIGNPYLWLCVFRGSQLSSWQLSKALPGSSQGGVLGIECVCGVKHPRGTWAKRSLRIRWLNDSG